LKIISLDICLDVFGYPINIGFRIDNYDLQLQRPKP